MINIGDIIAQVSPGRFDSFTQEGFYHLYEEEPSDKLADVLVLPTNNLDHAYEEPSDKLADVIVFPINNSDHKSIS